MASGRAQSSVKRVKGETATYETAAQKSERQEQFRKYLDNTKPKRGDVIAWAQRSTAYAANSFAFSDTTTYIIGIVTSVSRQGVILKADTGFGAPVAVDHSIESKGVRGDLIDLDVARAWLASSENYPRAGSVALDSMDAVRAVVRTWLKANRPV